ncbi:RALBP1 associated Eps domain containing isoform X1 [Dermatophagoides pteronyssinus]|uniref:RALBP1 associated Eps domain containing isoform X1 n=1 Tax=Dermatophagoides pteronyssinus TaxID=6956 RepID=UPI003F675C60
MSNFDKEKIVLPPPPQPPTKAKLKLKRVHTISGSSSSSSSSTSTDTKFNNNNNNSSSNNNNNCHQPDISSNNNQIHQFNKTHFNNNNDNSHQQQQQIAAANSMKTLSTTTTSLPEQNNYGQFTMDNIDLDRLDLDDDNDSCSLDLWSITTEQQSYYTKQFQLLQRNCPTGTIHGNVAKIFFEKSGLDIKDLSHIWKLSDIDEDGGLSFAEFCVAMHLVVLRRNKVELPKHLPSPLRKAHRRLMMSTVTTTTSSSLFHTINTQQVDGIVRSISSGSKQHSNVNTIDNKENGAAISLMKNDPSSSSCQRRHSQNWTRFNDSPNMSKIKPNSIDSNNIVSSTSPAKLANFDYNITDVIATNPNIRHPVPLRVSPTSPALVDLEHSIVIESDQNNYNNNDSKRSSLNDSFTSSNSIDSCREQFSPFKIINNRSNNKNSPNEFFIRNNSFPLPPPPTSLSAADLNGLQTLKQIIDHVRMVENRFEKQSGKCDNNNGITVIPFENSTKIDELQQSIRMLNESNQRLQRLNQELSTDLSSMIKIVNHLIKQYSSK